MTVNSQCELISPLPAARRKPCRSGQTGMRPFGTLGPSIDVSRYDEHLHNLAAKVKASLSSVIARDILDVGEVFPSPSTAHRHRAGPLIVRPSGSGDGSTLELAMWDPVAKAHSIVRASTVPIYSAPIAAAMEKLRKLPLVLDPELHGIAGDNVGNERGSSEWGRILGRGLRAMQFHSTLSDELLVCLVYHDERLKMLRRGERLPDEHHNDALAWEKSAGILRAALQQAAVDAGVDARVDVVGRWKRRRLVAERDYVIERFNLSDGRLLEYRQPEGQFSNPNAPCEVHCLNWLCSEASRIRRACNPGRARLLELHCGGGNNTVALAPYFDEVVAVEINRVLAEVAEENIKRNDIKNVRVIRAASAAAVDHLPECQGTEVLEAILVDPPRAGLDSQTRALVAKFDHVLYISCNPDALADDLKYLSSHSVLSFAFFDMFPYTTHSECAVRLQRCPTRSRCYGVKSCMSRAYFDTVMLLRRHIKHFCGSVFVAMLPVAFGCWLFQRRSRACTDSATRHKWFI